MAFYRCRRNGLQNGRIYGVLWDGSSTTQWTRTDDSRYAGNPNPYYSGMSGNPSSPFDYIMPWSGMVRVTDADAGELVAIPKFYFKLSYANPESATKGLKIQISMTQHTGFQCSPAHMDRGDGVGERDVIYVGRYKCANTYKSTTGATPANTITRANFRTGIHNLGSTIWQWDIATLMTIWMLYLVEFANWDSQGCIGYGCSDSGSMQVTGLTDSMSYHTGTTKTSRTTYGHIQYRNIEDLWANGLDWVDGGYFIGTNCYIIMNPSSFANDTGGTLVYTGSDFASTNYPTAMDISSVSGYEWFMCPSQPSASADSSTYITDNRDFRTLNNSSVKGGFMIGSPPRNALNYGLFYFGSYLHDGAYNFCASRLIKL